MSGELVAVLSIGTFLVYGTVATLLRGRVAVGRRTIARGSAFATWLPFFVWVPYTVIVLRPGPEVAFSDAVRWFGLTLVVSGIAFGVTPSPSGPVGSGRRS